MTTQRVSSRQIRSRKRLSDNIKLVAHRLQQTHPEIDGLDLIRRALDIRQNQATLYNMALDILLSERPV